MKQLQKRALWERIFLLLYAEIQLKISRIRRTKGPLSGLAKIAFKTRKKDDTENYFDLEIPRHLARKQFVDSTKVNVDACSNKFPSCCKNEFDWLKMNFFVKAKCPKPSFITILGPFHHRYALFFTIL